MGRSINFKIAAFILVALSLQVAISVYISALTVKNNLLDNAATQARLNATAIQHSLSYAFKQNDRQQVEEIVAAMGADVNTRTALLIDDKNNIIAATKRSIIGSPFSAHTIELESDIDQHIETIYATAKIVQYINDHEDTLVTLTPVTIGRTSTHTLKPDRKGILIHALDLQTIQKQLEEVNRNETYPLIFTSVMAILFIFIFLRQSITRRIASLNKAASSFTLNKPYQPLPENGKDEISSLIQSFNALAKQALQSHDELISNENLLKHSQEMAHVGSWEFDLVNDTLKWSDEVYRICGFEKNDDVSYKRFMEIVHPDDRDELDYTYKESLDDTSKKYKFEHRLLNRKTGEIRRVIEKCEHIRDRKGKVIRSIGMIHDITNRKKMEQALQESEEKYRRLFEFSEDPMWLIVDNMFVMSNNAACRALGYDNNEQLKNTHPSELSPPIQSDNRQSDVAANDMMDIAYRNGYHRFEWTHKRRNGELFPVEVMLTRVPYEGRDALFCIWRDISNQKEAERKLRDQQKENQQIIDSMIDSVITIDQTGIVETFNKASEKLFGYSAEEVIGGNISVIMDKHDADAHNNYLRHYVQTEDERIIGIGRDVFGKDREGNRVPIRLSVAKLPPGQDGKMRFIASIHDKSSERLQEEQLRQSQKMDALGKLTGGIAHDFNNMLGVITGFSDMLSALVEEGSKEQRYVSQIKQAGDRAAKLTSKLLAFSRQKPGDEKTVNINDLLKNSKDMLAKTLTARIQINYDLQEDLWLTRLEEAALDDAVLNMSINAMHAMSDGGAIFIQTRNIHFNDTRRNIFDLPPGDYITLKIVDSGIGMDETTRQKIFDPFFSTKGDGGTGLGLSQVYGFVQQSSGAIQVESQPGQGTTITICFPREKAEKKLPQGNSQDVDLSEFSGKEKLLVVDDEVALTTLAKETLGVYNYQVTTANDALTAIDLAKQNQFDLLITDVIMPRMDGYELINKFSEIQPNTPVLIASGFDDKQGSVDVLQDGFIQRINKPFHTVDLLRKIRSLLDQQH